MYASWRTLVFLRRDLDWPEARRAAEEVAMVVAGFGAISLLRVGLILGGYRMADQFFQPDLLESLVAMAILCLITGLAFTLVLLVNRRLLAAVSLQEEKFSRVFHGSPFAILLTRRDDGTILEVNDAFERLTGFPVAEALGRSTVDLRLWQDESERLAMLRQVAQEGAIHGAEGRFRQRSGEPWIGLYSVETLVIDQVPCLVSCIADITGRKALEREREALITDLQAAMGKVKTLSGILPICASCKKIRNDQGGWEVVEEYVKSRSHADFSHSLCPDCARNLYDDPGT